MNLPSFMIIGAAKSGTTALYHYLSQHPQVFMSPAKETRFFALDGEVLSPEVQADPPSLEYFNRAAGGNAVRDFESYQRLFAGANGAKAIGEASPVYLYSPRAPQRIKGCLPDVRMIAILRQPVARAYSHYLHRVRDGREPLEEFDQALREEDIASDDIWLGSRHYLRFGFYGRQLKRYFELFPREQIRIYLYEDLKDMQRLFRDMFDFIGVDPEFQPDTSTRHNVSGIPKNRLVHRILNSSPVLVRKLRPLVPTAFRTRFLTELRNKNLEQPKLSEDVRRKWTEVYREDILLLQDLTQRDLSGWLR